MVCYMDWIFTENQKVESMAPYLYSVDCEYDWGGRVNKVTGIKLGLPIILKIFRLHNIKAIFFISTEVLKHGDSFIKDILLEGHEIGSHGHFHIRFKDRFRCVEDRYASEAILKKYLPLPNVPFRYRAPRFNREDSRDFYSCRKSHVSILKHSWIGGKIPNDAIFYIHPFDIVGGSNAPNLLSKMLYSRPKRVYDDFVKLVNFYPGNERLV